MSRLLPPSPPTRSSGCLQLHPTATTAGKWTVSHLHSDIPAPRGALSGQLSGNGRLEKRSHRPGFLPPFGHRRSLAGSSCSRQRIRLPLRSAYRCPLHRTRTGFPCFARVRHDWGRTSSIPRGRRCPHGREYSTTAACRIAAALSLSPRHCIPARRVMLTRHHQGFPDSHPIPSLPLTCGPWTGQGPLGFPMSSAPGRYRPRTSWRGQVQTLTRSHVTGISQPPSNGLTPHVRPHVAGITHTSRPSNIRSPGSLRPADGFPVPLGEALLSRLLRGLRHRRARAP